MVSVPRRALGAVLVVVAGLLFAQPFLLRSTSTMHDELPTVADSGSLLGLLDPVLLAAGAVLFVSGVAAVLGRSLAPRWSLIAPLVSALVAVAFGVGAVPAASADPAASLPAVALSGTTPFVVAGSVVGASLAPVTLGAVKGDTVSLLAGVVLLLASALIAPASGFALVAGIVGGGLAVCTLWLLDPETWRP